MVLNSFSKPHITQADTKQQSHLLIEQEYLQLQQDYKQILLMSRRQLQCYQEQKEYLLQLKLEHFTRQNQLDRMREHILLRGKQRQCQESGVIKQIMEQKKQKQIGVQTQVQVQVQVNDSYRRDDSIYRRNRVGGNMKQLDSLSYHKRDKMVIDVQGIESNKILVSPPSNIQLSLDQSSYHNLRALKQDLFSVKHQYHVQKQSTTKNRMQKPSTLNDIDNKVQQQYFIDQSFKKQSSDLQLKRELQHQLSNIRKQQQSHHSLSKDNKSKDQEAVKQVGGQSSHLGAHDNRGARQKLNVNNNNSKSSINPSRNFEKVSHKSRFKFQPSIELR